MQEGGWMAATTGRLLFPPTPLRKAVMSRAVACTWRHPQALLLMLQLTWTPRRAAVSRPLSQGLQIRCIIAASLLLSRQQRRTPVWPAPLTSES